MDMQPTDFLRVSIFFGVFALFSLLELGWPRRRRRLSRRARWPVNGLLMVCARAVLALFPFFSAEVAAEWASRQTWGVLNLYSLPLWLDVLLTFVVMDAAVWLQHRVFHQLPWLWPLHRLHHSDLDLDASSALRFHPLEILVSSIWQSGVAIVLGADPVSVLLFVIILNVSAQFNHANWHLPRSIDGKLRWLIVTPDMHRIHHSVVHTEMNSNFGFCLSVWDRWSEKYCALPEHGQSEMTLGLPPGAGPEPTRITKLLADPFVNRG